jgi:hypothetical protein
VPSSTRACDLEADVVPIVARELPELPRPLKNWGAPWLVGEILAAREQRLAGHRVEAPPPVRRAPPAIDWLSSSPSAEKSWRRLDRNNRLFRPATPQGNFNAHFIARFFPLAISPIA